MNRRKVLASLATAGVMSTGFVAGKPQPMDLPVYQADLDEVRVVRNGNVVAVHEDPSTDEVMGLLDATSDEEELVTPEDDCIVYCLEDCPTTCESCMWACQCLDDGCEECC